MEKQSKADQIFANDVTSMSVARLMQLIERQQEQIVKLSVQHVALSEALFRSGARISRLETIVRRDTERKPIFEGIKA